MMIKLENQPVTLREFVRLFGKRDFWSHYYHKFVLCKLGRHTKVTNIGSYAYVCKYCKRSRPVLNNTTANDYVDKLVSAQREGTNQ